MPIEHTPNALSRPLECEKELERLQSCLKAYFKKQGKEAVFFEWVFNQGCNANLQNEDKRCGHSLTEAAAYFMLKFLEVIFCYMLLRRMKNSQINLVVRGFSRLAECSK